MRSHTIQWDHPKLDIIVQFFIDGDYIEVEHVYGYTYGSNCLLRLFDVDELIDDFQASTAYDEYMERRVA
jgi:hypothetical protein